MNENFITDFVEKKLAQPADQQSRPTLAGRDLAKGILAGLIGGVIATAAKSLAERAYPPRIHGEPEPPAVLSEKIAGHPLDESTKAIAEESIHWAFGAAAGAAYGALAEFYPAATAREGANFGMTLMALTHEGALPALGLSAQPQDQTSREKSSEMVTHVVFGIVTETVRRFVRSRI
jgi:putative membrane protein